MAEQSHEDGPAPQAPISPAPQAPISKVAPQPGWDAMLEDLLGLNIRGLNTVGAVFLKPKRVFEAARSRSWQDGAYTPSIRLFVSLMMLVLLLQAFWAGPDSKLARIQTDTIQAQIDSQVPEALLPFITSENIWQTAIVSMPFATLIVMFVAALLLRVWGSGAKTVTRVRYYFLAAIPGWVFSFGLAMVAEAFSASQALLIVSISPLIVMGIDGITAWRGNPAGYTKFARIWRAGLFGLTNTIVYVVASFAMFSYAAEVVTSGALEAAQAAGVVLTP